MREMPTAGLVTPSDSLRYEKLANSKSLLCKMCNSNVMHLQFCAPRETVIQQTWREEEDGTITVLGHSVESQNAPRSNGWSWYSPVRAEVTHLPGSSPSAICFVSA